jgi:hypothetical protein
VLHVEGVNGSNDVLNRTRNRCYLSGDSCLGKRTRRIDGVTMRSDDQFNTTVGLKARGEFYYLGTFPAVAALPPTPQSTPPLLVGRALLHAVPGSLFLPVLPVYDFCLVTPWETAD